MYHSYVSLSFFRKKGLISNKLILKVSNRLIKEQKDLATVMNIFFVKITERLDLEKDDDSSLSPLYSENINDTS